MIKEIKLEGIATYSKAATMQPLDINFCYGCNGSGKSTLANLISGRETSKLFTRISFDF